MEFAEILARLDKIERALDTLRQVAQAQNAPQAPADILRELERQQMADLEQLIVRLKAEIRATMARGGRDS
jgi:hypothetical protein